MKYCEDYGLVKGVIAAFLLVICAGFINSACALGIYCVYSSLVLNDSCPILVIFILMSMKDAVVPAICEETMRHISCRKGIIATFSFPIIVSLMEHFLVYAGEPLRILLFRLWLHILLTSIQFVGFAEKKVKIFFWIAVLLHFVNNFNYVLMAV